MNDKVTAVHTAPASTPAKDIPAAATTPAPEKAAETKTTEPVAAPAAKV